MKKSEFSRWPAPRKSIFSLTSPKKSIFSLTSPKKVDFFADQPKKSWFFDDQTKKSWFVRWPDQKKLILSLTGPKKVDFFADRCLYPLPSPYPRYIYIYIYIAIYAYMRMFHAYLWMFPPHLLPHQPTHIHPERNPQRGRAPRSAAPPFVEAARSAAPFLDGCGLVRQQMRWKHP